MFRCDQCLEITRPHESMNRIVVDKRDKSYHNKIRSEDPFTPKKETITKGWEIVREKKLCPTCNALNALPKVSARV